MGHNHIGKDMGKYKIFKSKVAFDTWHDKVNKKLNYPNVKTLTTQYTEGVKNPFSDEYCCVVDSKYSGFDTDTDLKTIDEVKILRWYNEEKKEHEVGTMKKNIRRKS